MMQLDGLDEKAAKVLNGYLVRKDLVRRLQSSVSGANLCG